MACNKKVKEVQRLEGTWKLIKMHTDSGWVIGRGETFRFDHCPKKDVRNNDRCSAVFTDTTLVAEPFEYNYEKNKGFQFYTNNLSSRIQPLTNYSWAIFSESTNETLFLRGNHHSRYDYDELTLERIH